MSEQKERVWEIDFVRGVFIIGVICSHLMYDSDSFFGTNFTPFLLQISKLSCVFIAICGISCTFSRNNLRRGLILAGCAGLVSLATWIYSPSDYVCFGILHLLTVCILLYHFVLKRLSKLVLFISAAATFALGGVFQEMLPKTGWLIPFGGMPIGFMTVDYFPIFPWISAFLVGIIIARDFYPERKSLFGEPPRFVRSLMAVGRHTLPIYLIHQPIILLVIAIFQKILRLN